MRKSPSTIIIVLQKCMEIQEMIQTADNRSKMNEKNAKEFVGINREWIDHYSDKAKANKAAQIRLQQYYNRLIQKAIQTVDANDIYQVLDMD